MLQKSPGDGIKDIDAIRPIVPGSYPPGVVIDDRDSSQTGAYRRVDRFIK